MGTPIKLKTKTITSAEFPAVHLPLSSIMKNVQDFLNNLHFIELTIQCMLLTIDVGDSATVLVGSDGRHDLKTTIEKVAQVLAGNAVSKVIIDLNIPMFAAPSLMRDQNCQIGFIFTSGYHISTRRNSRVELRVLSPPGIPIRQSVMENAIKLAKTLDCYLTCERLQLDLEKIEIQEYLMKKSESPFFIEVTTATSSYIREIFPMFNWDVLIDHLKQQPKFLIDFSNGVACQAGVHVFKDLLQTPEENLVNAEFSEDNSSLATEVPTEEFLERIKNEDLEFGAVISADGSRCIIASPDGSVVNISDTMAIIADNKQCIPLFDEQILFEVFRDISTSKAVDSVAESLKLPCFEVLSNWRSFGRAMLISDGASVLYGGESNGIGVSTMNFTNDRDGLWTLLAWLSILSYSGKSVSAVVRDHWLKYGRHVFGRIDVMELPKLQLELFLANMRDKIVISLKKIRSEKFEGIEYIDPIGIDPKLQTDDAKKKNTNIVYEIENYVEPFGFLRKSLIKDDKYLIYRVQMTENITIILKTSDYKNDSIVLHIYMDCFLPPDDQQLFENKKHLLEPISEATLKLLEMKKYFGTDIKTLVV